MQATIDRTNGGKGRINTVRIYNKDGYLIHCVYLHQDDSATVYER